MDNFNPYDQSAELADGKSGYWARLAVSTDIWINVLFGGKPDQTVSLRTSIAAGWRYNGQFGGPVRSGKKKWWGCVGCGILEWAQKGHCKDQFLSVATPPTVYFRAALMFVVAALILAAPVALAVWGLQHVWR